LANVTNIEFRDTDWDPANDWQATIANGAITWSTETFAQNEDANSLKWGTLYNFRFDANVPPADGHIGAQLFRPGTLLSNVSLSRVPRTGQAIAGEMTVLRGTKLMGEFPDLAFSDDSRVQLRPGVVLISNEAPIRVEVEGISPLANPASMTFRYEGHATDTSVGRTIEAFNFDTNQWVQVNAGGSTTSDSVTNVTINNPAQFVQDGNRTVRVRISYKPTGPVLVYPYTVRIDQGTWYVQ
jgi:hypothetical protein